MRQPTSQRRGHWPDKEPADSRVATITPLVGPATARNEVPERPSAAYLRHLILALIDDRTTPISIQGECVKLMRAINSNDLPKITELVVRLARLADAEGFTLPRLDKEPLHRD